MKHSTFSDFLQTLNSSEIPIALDIDELLRQSNCAQEIKEAASGFTVSYSSAATKKSVACFVCRKTGLKLRLTPAKPFACDDLLNTLPENMKNDVIRAAACKRLSDPNACNSRCAMGYAFTLEGVDYKKCRSMAFLFAVTEENLPFIRRFIEKTLSSSGQ